MPPLSWWLTGAALAASSFALRVWAQRGLRPIGLDTWYYLAYADAVRQRPSFDVRLSQYLLQDQRQSYPPLFPMLLALMPALFDSAHVLLLFWMTATATESAVLGSLAAAALAVSPQAVAEPPGLHGRSLGGLLHSAAVMVTLEAAGAALHVFWLAAAILLGAALFLASAAMSVAYGIVMTTLSVVRLDARFVLIACGGLLLAVIVSGGHYVRVALNFWQAAQYSLRNRNLFGAHPIRHSPLYGNAYPADRPVPLGRGLLGQGVGHQLLRLLGENPYVLALPLASTEPASRALLGVQTWAIALTVLSGLMTLAASSRFFGLGRSYMRAALFPALYGLAASIADGPRGTGTLLGGATLVCFGLSLTSTVVVYLHRRRSGSGADASSPDGLADAVRALASLPPGGVLCMPYHYAGYASYHSGKPVLWGGHCGDLRRWEALAPVITRPIPALMQEYRVRYVLLDTSYALPSDIGLESAVKLRDQWELFSLYEVIRSG